MSNHRPHVHSDPKSSSGDPPPQQDHQDQHPFEQPSVEQILHALKTVYHQTNPSFDGAAPSLNALLQGPYFDDEALTQLTGGGPIDAYAVNMALRGFTLSLEPVSSSRARGEEAHEQVGFLCFQHDRWFALRRVGQHWLNLNNVICRPAQILPRHLSVSLGQLQEDGCEVYVVKGNLPACAADEIELFKTHFEWALNGGIVQAAGHGDDMEETGQYRGYACENEEYLDEEEDELDEEEEEEEAFENDLQTAIARSIADMQEKRLEQGGGGEREGERGLVIKSSTSPPTSIMSCEPVGAEPGRLQLEDGEGKQGNQKG